MSYNTVAEFRKYALSKATFANTGSYPDDLVQNNLDDAASLIDAALYVHHNLPMASGSVPPFIRKAERDMCAYTLLLNIGFDPAREKGDAPIIDAYFRVAGSPDKPNQGILWELREGRLQIPDYSTNVSRPGSIKVVQVPGNSIGYGYI